MNTPTPKRYPQETPPSPRTGKEGDRYNPKPCPRGWEKIEGDDGDDTAQPN